jgi:hypothetical protein
VVTGAALDEEPDEEPDEESLDDEPLEPEPLDEPSVVVPLVSVPDEAACAEVAAEVAAAEDFAFAVVAGVAGVEVWDFVPAPSAGSCPVTRGTKIATQTATKRQSVITATRRRIPRVRCLRAQTRWRARRRPSSGDVGGGVEIGSGMPTGSAPAVRAA